MATIKDVASRAGVSTATVSHVFNQTRFVSSEVQQRVREAAKELGYVSNGVARSLRSNRSYRIGLLVPNIANYFSVDIIEPMEALFRENGYQLVVGYTHENLAVEKEQVAFFDQQRIDGMLLFPAPGDHSYLAESPRSYPIVFLDRKPAGIEGDYVGHNNEDAAYTAINTMIQEGHRHIGIIRGLQGISNTQERFMGYTRALRDNGIEPDPDLIIDADALNSSALYTAGITLTKQLLKHNKMTALYVCNNLMSLGALAALNQECVRVPQDVALLGMGSYIWADVTCPPLSLLSPSTVECGRKAAELLLKRIKDGGTGYKNVTLPMELIRRKSF